MPSAQGSTAPRPPALVAARRPVPIEITRGALLPAAALGLVFVAAAAAAPPPLLVAVAALGGFGGLVSLLVHELGHVAAARRLDGVEPLRVSLLWLGAGTTFAGAYRNGRDQARVAAAGPAVSLAVAALLLLGALLPAPRPVQLGLFGLALLNAAIALVSLLPVDPLDGHKLLVGLVWCVAGSERRARTALRRAGRIGLAAAAAGCSALLVATPPAGGVALVCAGLLLVQQKVAGRARLQRA